MLANMSSNDGEMRRLRGRIDATDEKLLDVLAERMEIVDQIGMLKQREKLDARDEKRRSAVLESRASWGENRGLLKDAVTKIFEMILDYSEERERN